MNVGNRIKAIRDHFKESQETFAKKTGVSQVTIRHYESEERKPGQDFLVSLFKEYHVDITWLLTGQGDDPFIDLSFEDQANYKREKNEKLATIAVDLPLPDFPTTATTVAILPPH